MASPLNVDWNSGIDNTVLNMAEVGRIFIVTGKDHYEELLGIDEIQTEVSELESTLRHFSVGKHQFDIIEGTYQDFQVSKVENYGDRARLDCLNSDSVIASLKDVKSEIISSATTLLLGDKIVVTSKNDIKCDLGGDAHYGLSCAGAITEWSESAGKVTGFIDGNSLYGYLVNGQPGDAYHVGINSTHVIIGKGLTGYAMCTRAKQAETSFRSVLQDKYFGHMGDIALAMTQDIAARISHAEMVAYHLVSEQLAANGKSDWLTEHCGKLYVLKECIGSGRRSSDSWDFYGNRRTYAAIDGNYVLASKELVDQCSDQGDPLALAQNLLAMRALHMDMDNIRRQFGSTTTSPDRLLLVATTTDLDMDDCMALSFGVQLSASDRAYTIDKIYAAKLRFLQHTNYATKVSQSLFSHKTVNLTKRSTEVSLVSKSTIPVKDNVVLARTKRADEFARFLSGLTGLGTNTDIGLLQRNIVRENDAIAHDEEEILKLDKKANEILRGVKEQSLKVGRLWDDESKLHDSLTKVIKDERNTLDQMAHLSRGLEASSDIAAEFMGILLAIERLHDLTTDVEDTISAVMSKGRLIRRWPTDGSTLDKRVVKSARLDLRFTKDGITVTTSVDNIADEFVTYDIKILPILIPKSNLTVHFDISSAGYGVNSVGYVVELGNNLCNRQGRDMYCKPSEVTVRVTADNCVEEILTSKSVTGTHCKQAAQVGIATRQEYLMDNGQFKVYTPRTDNYTIFCNGSVKRQGLVQKGVTIISIPDDCRLVTSQIVAYGNTVGKEIVVDHVTEDMVDELSRFQQDLENLHGLDFGNMDHDIMAYGNFTNSERLDLDKLNMSVTKFMAVQEVTEYRPFRINLEKPAGLQNQVSGLTIGLCLFVGFVFMWALKKNRKLRKRFWKCLCCCICACCPDSFNICGKKSKDDSLDATPKVAKKARRRRLRYDSDSEYDGPRDFSSGRYRKCTPKNLDKLPGSDNSFDGLLSDKEIGQQRSGSGDSDARTEHHRERRYRHIGHRYGKDPSQVMVEDLDDTGCKSRKRIPRNKDKKFYGMDKAGREYYINPDDGREYYLDEHELTDGEFGDAHDDSGVIVTPPQRDVFRMAAERNVANALLRSRQQRELDNVQADVEKGVVTYSNERTKSVPNLASGRLWILDNGIYKRFQTDTIGKQCGSVDHGLDDDPTSPELGDWVRIRVNAYRLVLIQDTGARTLYYDYYANKIINQKGEWIRSEPFPDDRFIGAYVRAFQALPIPDLVTDGKNYFLKDNPSIRYSFKWRRYTNCMNGDVLTGIRRPNVSEKDIPRAEEAVHGANDAAADRRTLKEE